MNNDEYLELCKKANRYSETYYTGKTYSTNKEQPEISDAQFDALIEKIKKYEKTHTPCKNSPTQKVGSDLTKGFKKVVHTHPMLSLSKKLNIKDLGDWLREIQSKIPGAKFVLEYKMDGAGLDLTYKKGILQKVVTRGDGIRGDDITDNAREIDGVLQKLPQKVDIQIRGEVIMPHSTFEKMISNGEDLKNCRASAIGAMRHKNSNDVKRFNLKFYSYYIVSGSNEETQEGDIELLQSLGFKTIRELLPTSDIKKILDYCEKMASKRKALDFDIDGMVIKINKKKNWKKLGESAVNPKWAMAYKFPNEVVTPIIKDVVFQVGRTGIIAPVAIYEPMLLCGTTVERASLHNKRIIDNLGISIGDQVEVIKSGEIIPQVRGIFKKAKRGKEIVFPKECPCCGEKTKFVGAYLYCTNRFCEDQVVGRISHWCSKSNMDIKGVGEETISLLYRHDLVKDVTDLYKLTKKQLLSLDGIQKTSAENILNSIEKSKSAGLGRVISGLGIGNLGSTISEEVAGKFGDIDSLMNCGEEKLKEVDIIGEKRAMQIVKFFNRKSTRKIIESLKKYGIILGERKAIKKSNDLKGKSFCVTGTLSVSRSDIQTRIKENGGMVSSSISSKTNYLISGVGGGSKLSKAEKLGIKIISENDFNKMLKGELK